MTSTTHGPVTVAAGGGYELAEGGRWTGGRFVYVDILSGRLFELPDRVGALPRPLARIDVPLGAVAPVHGRPDTWIAAAGTGIALLHPGGGLEWLDRPEDRSPVPTRMNDGVADPAGRFWAGSMPYDGTPGAGSLYRTDPDGTVVRVLDGLAIVNGPAFDAGGTTLYLADSAAGVIHRCRVDPATGDLTGPEAFVRFGDGEGSPDGMTVDDEGCLWVAVWGGGAVRRYHPDGRLLHTLALPAPQPSSVCLHPTESRILITTARHGLDRPSAASGAVLSAPVAARAPETPAWGEGGPAPE